MPVVAAELARRQAAAAAEMTHSRMKRRPEAEERPVAPGAEQWAPRAGAVTAA
jgi:hypothetical protein